MVSEHARIAFEHKGSDELLELRKGGTLTEELTKVLDEVLRARGIDPSAVLPASASRTKPVAEYPLVVARRVRAVAWFQLLAGAAIFTGAFWARTPPGASFSLFFVLLTLVAGLNIIAGVLTLRGQHAGYWLSVWNNVVQIPVIGVPGFFFHYKGLGDFVFLVESTPGLHVYAEASPGLRVALGATPPPYFIGVDLLAVGIVGLLLSALRLQKTHTESA